MGNACRWGEWGLAGLCGGARNSGTFGLGTWSLRGILWALLERNKNTVGDDEGRASAGLQEAEQEGAGVAVSDAGVLTPGSVTSSGMELPPVQKVFQNGEYRLVSMPRRGKHSR